MNCGKTGNISILFTDTTALNRIQKIKDAREDKYDEFYDQYSHFSCSHFHSYEYDIFSKEEQSASKAC